ncbi:MAG: FAD binding domain-containing protein [Bacteroidales bacterium]
MVSFVLNNSIVNADVSPGTALIDYIRYEKDLPGTKIGCREGDCGACTVLEGSLQGDKVVYKSIVSCLTPVGNVHGKHIVTIEGLNMKELSPVQSALVENSGTQCGFCTPGFVMSLTCNCMKDSEADISNAIDAISGNICRCTGYKSIERAAESITVLMKDKDVKNPIKWLVDKNYIPAYFTEIPKLLKEIKENKSKIDKNTVLIGGGTDLVVQKPLEMAESKISFLYNNEELKGISKEAGKCIIKASTTADMIMKSPIMLDIIPEISSFFKLVSSEPVRNMGTIAGNIVNASPIADLTMFFLALDAEVVINSGNSTRVVPLRKFYLGYKKLDLKENEFIEAVSFKIPEKPFHFNFEKVSKRTYLDIASVNSACYIKDDNGTVVECRLSVGGVSPIPLFLEKTSAFLEGKNINANIILDAADLLQEEISPISDVRGSDKYKRLLARQLFFAHFIKLFPGKFSGEDLLSKKI